MRLADLLDHVDPLEVHGLTDVDVRRVTRDSREAGEGVLFVAVRGERVDGHAFVAGLGAGAALVEEAPEAARVPWIRVRDTREALAQAAAAVAGFPAAHLPVVGVTGTNGKTTVTSLCEGALAALGRRGGRIGTLGAAWWDEERPTGLTTPEAPELHRLLAEMRSDAVEAAFVEASSIALVQRRVDALPFHTVVFTNLGRDHLDFHGDMDGYAAAKALLFDQARLRAPGGMPRALLCGDDPAWPAMRPPEDRWLYGLSEGCDLRIVQVALSEVGQRVAVRVPARAEPVLLETRLVGAFNALNAVAALGALRTLGLAWDEAARGLGAVPGVPGRLQRVGLGVPRPGPPDASRLPAVFVDYAHTPDALDAALRALRPLVGPRGQLVVVFGCGGDRDPGKRAPMGRVAAELADRVVLTSDNPRSEDPDAILAHIRAGTEDVQRRAPRRISSIPDRARAIRFAVTHDAFHPDEGVGRGDDVVLIAGKGHEKTQQIGGTTIPFDDVEVAEGALGRLARLLEVMAAMGGHAQRPRIGQPHGHLLNDALIAAATGGRLVRAGPRDAGEVPRCGPVLTDTRLDLGGAWFLALVGARFDGHDYLRAAREGGAVGVIVSRIPDDLDLGTWDRGLIHVADTTVALQDLARSVVDNLAGRLPIVGVAGSSGKTTTRALIACALAPLGRVHQTSGNLNNHLGVPMTLLAAPADAAALVVELGTDSPGEVAFLSGIARPSIRLVVNVAHEHLDGLGGIEGVAAEEGALFDTAGPGDVLVVNADDPWLRDRRPGAGQRALRFGRAEDADVRLIHVDLDPDALTTTARVATPEGEVTVELPAFGTHFAVNATAALACALAAGVPAGEAAAAMAAYEPVGLRQRIERLGGGTLVLNDAYNANPLSMQAALDTLGALGGRGVAALGDMLELGAEEEALHRQVLSHAAGLGLDRIVLVGPRMAAAAGAAPGARVFDTPEAAGAALRGTLGPDHRLLVKGSRSIAMERVLHALQDETPEGR